MINDSKENTNRVLTRLGLEKRRYQLDWDSG